MNILNYSLRACVVLAIALPLQAMAQSAVPDVNNTGFDKPVESATLDGYRGGSDLVRTDVMLSGVTADNNAINVTSGSNTISAGSFANMSGMPMVIQNTGANVLIQNSMTLQLQMN